LWNYKVAGAYLKILYIDNILFMCLQAYTCAKVTEAAAMLAWG
jgi:hypothetical protein